MSEQKPARRKAQRQAQAAEASTPRNKVAAAPRQAPAKRAAIKQALRSAAQAAFEEAAAQAEAMAQAERKRARRASRRQTIELVSLGEATSAATGASVEVMAPIADGSAPERRARSRRAAPKTSALALLPAPPSAANTSGECGACGGAIGPQLPASCAWSFLPPAIAARMGRDIRRVVLIANNTHITRALADFTLRDDDLLVLFGCTTHLDFFANRPNPKLFFFRADFDTGRHWGLPPHPTRFDQLEAMAKRAPFGVLTTRHFPDTSTYPPHLKALFGDAQWRAMVSEQHSAWADYPDTPGEFKSRPSSGFAMLRLLMQARGAQCAARPGSARLELVLLGFNPTTTGTFWEGHSWDWERAYTAKAPHVCVVPAFKPMLRITAVRPPGTVRKVPGKTAIPDAAGIAVKPIAPLASFIDNAEPVTIDVPRRLLRLSFQIVALFEDAPIDGFVVTLAGAVGSELRTVHAVRASSTTMASKFKAAPWAGKSRFKIIDSLNWAMTASPEIITLYAVCGSALRPLARARLAVGGAAMELVYSAAGGA